MAATSSFKSEGRMWSGHGENLMEMDGMFDLDLVLTVPQLAAEETSSSAHGTTLVPLQPSELESLVSEMPTVISASNDACPVCMEELIHSQQPPPTPAAATQAIEGQEEEGKGRGAAKQMSCGHVFHSSCITAWLSLRGSCPLCRHHLLS